MTLIVGKGIVESIYLDSLLTWCKEERGKTISGQEGQATRPNDTRGCPSTATRRSHIEL